MLDTGVGGTNQGDDKCILGRQNLWPLYSAVEIFAIGNRFCNTGRIDWSSKIYSKNKSNFLSVTKILDS